MILDRLRGAGLTANVWKCSFRMKSFIYLGHVVGEGQVHPEPSKVEAIRNFPQPKSKKAVRAFLGIAGYYTADLFPTMPPRQDH